MRRRCWWTLGIVVAVLAGASPAGAADTFVDDDRPGDTGSCLTPATACKTIAAAIPKAGSGDTVHVAEGTYTEPQLVTNGRSLDASGTAASTIVQPAAAVPALIVTTGTASDIEGFTIRCEVCSVDQLDVNAPGTIRDNIFDGDSTGSFGDLAVRVGSGAVTVARNEFTDPDPTDQQIAINATSNASPVIRENRISGFYLGIQADRGSAVIRDNDIAGTRSPGSAIRIASAGTDPISPTIIGNDIHDPDTTSGTQPNGIFMTDTPGPPLKSATLERNRISHHSPGVAAINTDGPVTMNGDLVTGASLHGITVVDTTETASSPTGPGDVTATNVTSFNNAFDFNIQDAHLTLDSSISSDGIRTLDSGATDTSTCSISFSRGPATNIATPPASCDSSQFSTNADPQFVDAAAGDFHLLAGSTMIDAGNTTPPAPGTLDLDGDDRALAGTCGGAARRDIGADEFVADCTPPDTQIGGTPANDTVTSSRSASLTFTSTEPGSTFECAQNGVDFTPCTSPLQLSGLPDGNQQIFVRARDAAGNVDASAALRAWRVDATAPDTTIDSGPADGASTDKAVSYGFSSNEAGASFECAVDGDGFTPCSSPATVDGLSAGEHTFRVRATDRVGNVDASPAQRTLVVPADQTDTDPPDTDPPETTILRTKVKGDDVKVRFASDEPGSTFRCRLDKKAFRPCTSPKRYRSLGDGRHRIFVLALDGAGNLDGSAAKARFEIGG